MKEPSSDRISPTAHYTGYTWFAHGLSHPAFVTPSGRWMYRALAPANRVLALAGRADLEGYLLARHRILDGLLREAIRAGQIEQVIEIACGLSPRGHRFSREFGESITYVEADLPAMAARKRAIVAQLGGDERRHRVVAIDALSDAGPQALAAIAADLEPGRGLAIVTEGLINYLAHTEVMALWRRIAQTLARFPRGMYLSDLTVASDLGGLERWFARALGGFVRGRVHVPFLDEEELRTALADCGFSPVRLCDPVRCPELAAPGDARSGRLVRIVAAEVAR